MPTWYGTSLAAEDVAFSILPLRRPPINLIQEARQRAPPKGLQVAIQQPEEEHYLVVRTNPRLGFSTRGIPMSLPGFRLPTVVRTPFLGEILERATQEQHENGFDCQRIGYRGVHKMPVQWEKATPNLKEFYLEEFYEYKNYSVGAHSLHTQNMNIDQALKFILSVNAKTCKQFHPQDLILHGDIGYDAEQQFANEAKMAVRLANFISAFLQATMTPTSCRRYLAGLHCACADREVKPARMPDHDVEMWIAPPAPPSFSPCESLFRTGSEHKAHMVWVVGLPPYRKRGLIKARGIDAGRRKKAREEDTGAKNTERR
uniref:Uncharacterized protein n=1 Tax=Timema cristinae TaxID=61476 RepID=A0A7R9H1F1_TIMCR|nr:unnamed protein product [Timema cristinae]